MNGTGPRLPITGLRAPSMTHSLRQNEFPLARLLEPIQLTSVLDPNLISASREIFKADDLGSFLIGLARAAGLRAMAVFLVGVHLDSPKRGPERPLHRGQPKDNLLDNDSQ